MPILNISIFIYNKISVFIRQNHTQCCFKKDESWVVLSDIEQRIKKKIESVGTPLKDWDIQINYGIKTGFNEAFVISGEKRKELIEQDPKSAEIIRPLLRGRDIKRYGYEFADLYLITTFPSLKIDINMYPAVKQHLLSFGYDRLKQTGEAGARKKTNNRWFETQDTISYWEDFYKQKIVWNRIAHEKQFAFVKDGIFIQDSMHFIVGNHLKYLCCILNSKLFVWLMYLIVGDAVGGNAGNADNVKNLVIPKPNNELELRIENLLQTNDYRLMDNIVYEIYDLTEEEIKFISSSVSP
jgi:hypothetical protein